MPRFTAFFAPHFAAPHFAAHFASFRFKMTVLVAAMVLAAAAGVGAIALRIAEDQMARTIGQQELATLGGVAAYIDSDVRHKQQLLHSLAEEIQARRLGPAGLQQMLEDHGSLREEFLNLTAFDARGMLVASMIDRRAKPLDASQRPYFIETMASRDSVISAPFRSRLSGRPIVSVTQPLLAPDGRIFAVLVASIDLLRPSFAARIDALRGAAYGYLFIVAADGTVVHHPRHELVLTKPSAATAPILTAPLQQRLGWRTDLKDGGAPALVAFSRLDHVDWSVAVSYPLRDAFAPMAAMRLQAIGAATAFVLFAAIAGWALVTVLMEPLAVLRRGVEELEAGSGDIAALDSTRRDEFGVLSRALYRLSQHRARSEEELHRQATTDVLTGVHNRRMFAQFLPQALARASRAGRPLALAFLDVDNFKAINDQHGHAAGDAVLVEFARRLRGAVRITDTVARLAGDEFVIVYEQLRDCAEAHELGAKILAALAPPFVVGELTLQVTASVGIAVTGRDVTDEQVMHAADVALYDVKAAGRNGYAVKRVGSGKLVSVKAGRPAGDCAARDAAV